MTQWFALGNSALDDGLPLDVIGVDPRAVLDAARRDRYIAKG